MKRETIKRVSILGGIIVILISSYLYFYSQNICWFNYKYPLKDGLFDIKTVSRDLRENLKRRDFRFLCLWGVALSIPPDISPDNRLVKKYGYKCICVDDFFSKAKKRDLKKIYSYIKSYNLLLLKELNKTSTK